MSSLYVQKYFFITKIIFTQ